jgi:hypothetical protein
MFGISYVPGANGVLASCVQWMIHPNASQGIRYMPNARNAAYPAMLPQGFPRAMPSLQQVDGSSLASVLASASPEVQQQVESIIDESLHCSLFNSFTNLQVVLW